jgi:hypothetical protein
MKTYAIQWKSTVSGSIGIGTKRFEKEEAERLATELNAEYPDIDHEAVIPVPLVADPAVAYPLPPQVVEPSNTLSLPECAS